VSEASRKFFELLYAVFKSANSQQIWMIYYCCLFSISAYEKMRNFQKYFSRIFQDLRLHFPGPKWFSKTFQVLQFSRKNPGLSRKRGNPARSTIRWLFMPQQVSNTLHIRNMRTPMCVHELDVHLWMGSISASILWTLSQMQTQFLMLCRCGRYLTKPISLLKHFYFLVTIILQICACTAVFTHATLVKISSGIQLISNIITVAGVRTWSQRNFWWLCGCECYHADTDAEFQDLPIYATTYALMTIYLSQSAHFHVVRAGQDRVTTRSALSGYARHAHQQYNNDIQ